MIKIYCPFCNFGFNAERWDMGECPNCKEEYWWEEGCTDCSGTWDEIWWKKWDNQKSEMDY
jgi:hypothetical protein